MPESPLAASPYDVLGVPATASHEELRRAYRRKLRQTHPDAGGAAELFHAVQRAWQLVGTPEARAAYDRGGPGGPSGTARSWAPEPPPRRRDTRPQTRSHGHPGGWFREQYLSELRAWVGRGVEIPDPYDPALLRSAPRSVQHLLAAAVAEEDTARVLATLGIGFSVWHDVATTVGADLRGGVGMTVAGVGGVPTSSLAKLDHVVLGPTGLWALLSEDWGAPVKTKRSEVIGEALDAGERPVRDLSARARAFARSARVKFSGLIVVVPDGASPEDVIALGTVRGAHALLVQRPRLAHLLRTGVAGVGVGGTDLFEVRTRVQSAVRFV